MRRRVMLLGLMSAVVILIPGFGSADATQGADLAVFEQAAGDVVAGEEVDYTITVTNKGPSPATGVQVTDTLDSHLTFVSSDPSGCTASGQTVTCTATASLAVGASLTFKLRVMVAANTPAGTTIDNVATGTTTAKDNVPANNTGTAPVATVVAVSDLVIAKTDPAQLVLGTEQDYTITVTNKGPSDAQNAEVVDTLDSNLTFVSATGGTCSASGQTVTCTVATIAAGATTTITLKVKVSPTAPTTTAIKNTASVTSDSTDPNTSDNTTTTPGVTPTALADLEVTKTGPVKP